MIPVMVALCLFAISLRLAAQHLVIIEARVVGDVTYVFRRPISVWRVEKDGWYNCTAKIGSRVLRSSSRHSDKALDNLMHAIGVQRDYLSAHPEIADAEAFGKAVWVVNNTTNPSLTVAMARTMMRMEEILARHAKNGLT